MNAPVDCANSFFFSQSTRKCNGRLTCIYSVLAFGVFFFFEFWSFFLYSVVDVRNKTLAVIRLLLYCFFRETCLSMSLLLVLISSVRFIVLIIR